MNAFDWIYQIVVEGLKYIILGHWFLGFPFRQDKAKFWLAGYFLMIPVVEILDIPHTVFIYFYSWGALLIIFLFEGKFIEKIKAFFVMWFLIAMVDALIMVVFVVCISKQFVQNNYVFEKTVGAIGLGVWCLGAFKMKKVQVKIQEIWNSLSTFDYFIVLAIFSMISLLLGGMQSYLYNEMNVSIESTAFIAGVAIAGSLLIVLGLLIYTKQSKRRLEQMNQLNIEYMKLQRRYYESSLEQYEDMRRFRHDINNHLYLLSRLCEEKRYTEVKQYVETISVDYEKIRSVHTGNFIADCIVGRTLYELEKEGEIDFQMMGHFSKELILEDIDFCILLSNILDNAREALLEQRLGKRILQMEIKQYQEHYYLRVRNSTGKEMIDFSSTDKKNAVNHGYGIRNIKGVVEKYHGTVEWRYENHMVEVKVAISGQKKE